MPRLLMNEAIVASEVALMDEHGHDLGLMARSRALAVARQRGCDLVQDGVYASPPRCTLVPAGNLAARTAREARRAAADQPKEIRVGTAMGAHDVATRRRQAAGLLAKGYHVKLSARLAKAERANPVAARALLEGMARELASEGRVVRRPFGESGALSLLLAPHDEP